MDGFLVKAHELDLANGSRGLVALRWLHTAHDEDALRLLLKSANVRAGSTCTTESDALIRLLRSCLCFSVVRRIGDVRGTTMKLLGGDCMWFDRRCLELSALLRSLPQYASRGRL